MYVQSLLKLNKKMFSIVGKVMDELSNKSIENAVVLLRNKTLVSFKDIAQVTTENGIFKWNDLEEDTYIIQVIFEGYETKNTSVNGREDETKMLVVSLKKT